MLEAFVREKRFWIYTKLAEKEALWAPPSTGLLLDLAGEFGRACDGGTLIDIVRTHQEFADDIGATRETVSMTLAGFRRDGLVANQGRYLVITDASRLSAITGTNMGWTR